MLRNLTVIVQLRGKPVLRNVTRTTTSVYRQCDVSIEKKIDQSECVKFFEDRHDSEGMTMIRKG